MISTLPSVERVIAGYGRSDLGRVRENNEDNFICDNSLGLFAVIDGMGGKAAGEVAAGIARDIIVKRMAWPTGSAEERLREAITLANNEIYRQGQLHPEWKGMGCVLTVALIEREKLTIGHVGDTRLYVSRQGKAAKITRDHSPIGLIEDGGLLAEVEAMQHPRRNEVLRDVGSEPHSPDDTGFIEIIERQVAPGESVLLCSDGLTDVLTREQVFRIELAHQGDAAAIVEALITAANEAGGRDNVTVVYVPSWRDPVPLIDRYRFSLRELLVITGLVSILTGLATAWIMDKISR